LAWSMWKNTGTLKIQNHNTLKNSKQIALKGFLINILNPKLSIFFLAFLPQFVPANVEKPVLSMLLLSLTFMVMTFVVFVLYGIFAGSMRDYVLNSPKIMNRAQRSFALIFASLGAKLAFTEQ
ncbi:MAG: LysE family translocator, partial [Emcibacteraceae bacterium]|nr:LysE family translocator [Emcibacteraceae bacterium]